MHLDLLSIPQSVEMGITFFSLKIQITWWKYLPKTFRKVARGKIIMKRITLKSLLFLSSLSTNAYLS